MVLIRSGGSIAPSGSCLNIPENELLVPKADLVAPIELHFGTVAFSYRRRCQFPSVARTYDLGTLAVVSMIRAGTTIIFVPVHRLPYRFKASPPAFQVMALCFPDRRTAWHIEERNSMIPEDDAKYTLVADDGVQIARAGSSGGCYCLRWWR